MFTMVLLCNKSYYDQVRGNCIGVQVLLDILIIVGYFNMYLFIHRNLENDPSKRIETAVGVL